MGGRAAAVGAALAVALGGGTAARADTITLLSPVAPLEPPPPLLQGGPTTGASPEIRFLGHLASRELVVVGLGRDGSPARITATQRIVISRTGDFTFVIPAPATSVAPVPGRRRSPVSATSGSSGRASPTATGFSPRPSGCACPTRRPGCRSRSRSRGPAVRPSSRSRTSPGGRYGTRRGQPRSVRSRARWLGCAPIWAARRAPLSVAPGTSTGRREGRWPQPSSCPCGYAARSPPPALSRFRSAVFSTGRIRSAPCGFPVARRRGSSCGSISSIRSSCCRATGTSPLREIR